jgi:hypothetical protein
VSHNDSFIDEVTEEVRRDKLFALMRKYGWIAVLLVVLIVAGAAYVEWQKARTLNMAQSFGDGVLTALQNDDAAARVAALGGVPAEGERRMVLEFLQAAEELGAKDKAAALAGLQTVADDASLPESYRQLATLKSVILQGPDMDRAAREAALAGLATAGAPFRPLAMEQQALILVEDGNTDEAVAQLRNILQEPNVTAGLRRRTTQLIVALGADPDAA